MERGHPSDQTFLAGDALRAIAAIGVFIYHAAFGAAVAAGLSPVLLGATATSLNDAYGPLTPVIESFPLGVYVFFSLSGYLLSRRFIRAFVERTAWPSIPSYLRNRVLRILPAFWVVFALSLLRYGADGSTLLEVGAVPLFSQLYVGGPVTELIGHAWTIDTEWILYLGIPLAAVLIGRLLGDRGSSAGRLWLVFGLIGALFAASLVVHGAGPEETRFQRAMPAILWSFLPGVALAALELVVARRVRDRAWATPLAWAMAAGALASAVVYGSLGLHATVARAFAAGAFTGLVIGAPLVYQWSTSRCWLLLDNRPLRWLGVRSYSFYLVHFLIGVEVARLVDAGTDVKRQLALTVPPAFVLTLLASALLYRFVELPFLTRKRGRRRASAPVQVEAARPAATAGR